MDNLSNSTTLCQCLQQLTLDKYRSILHDHRAKKLFTGNTIQLHVAGQLLGLTSYDMITEQLHASESLRELTGLDSISPSALSRKTTALCTETLQNLFVRLVQQIQQLHSKNQASLPGGKKLSVIDATEITLPIHRSGWAHCSKNKHGIKMHTRVVVADPKRLVYPDRMMASTSDVNETEVSLELVTDPEAVHVMDRGYQKHRHFEQWTQPGKEILFVARIRENTRMTTTRDYRIPKADKGFLIWDRKVMIHQCKRPLRLVKFRDKEGKEYFLITNCFDVKAAEIAQMYKHRWLIELFFKWIKQHLRLVKVWSTSPQGIWNQLYLVLIASALNILIGLQVKTNKTAWDMLKLIRIYAGHPWSALLKAIARKPGVDSKGRQPRREPPEPIPILKKWIVMYK